MRLGLNKIIIKLEIDSLSTPSRFLLVYMRTVNVFTQDTWCMAIEAGSCVLSISSVSVANLLSGQFSYVGLTFQNLQLAKTVFCDIHRSIKSFSM